MKLRKFKYLLILFVLTGGCKKEIAEPIEIKPLYTLPQGNHPYDEIIMDFHRKYGTYILYKFTDKDFRWNVTGNILFVATEADENYVEASLTALNQYLFKFYPEEFLKRALPYKIILASRIQTMSGPNSTVPLDNYVNAASSYSHFAFGRAGNTLNSLTPAQLKLMKAELHREFWRQAGAFNKIILPPAFISATDYSVVTNILPVRRANGVFTVLNSSTRQTPIGDLADYIYNFALLTPQEWEQTVFIPTIDTHGRYRIKYNIILKYFKETYGVDLLTLSQNN